MHYKRQGLKLGSKQEKNDNQINFLDSGIDYQEEYKKVVVNKIKSDTQRSFRFSIGEFISWMGGKTKAAKELAGLLNHIPHDVFVDSFFGGGAEFWAKNKVKHNIINDKNENLFNLLEVIQNNLNDFLYFIFHTIKDKSKFDEWKKLYKSNKWNELDKIQRAAIYYYLMFFTVNSDETSMGFSYSKLPNTYNTTSMYVRLIRTCEKLQGVSIYNKDFSWIERRFNNDKNGKVLFFYDPPYVVTNKGNYYKHSAKEDSRKQTKNEMSLHYRLLNCCKRIDQKENYFFITYDNVPIIRTMYKDFNIIPFQIQYGSNAKLATEIIITNSNWHKQMEMF